MDEVRSDTVVPNCRDPQRSLENGEQRKVSGVPRRIIARMGGVELLQQGVSAFREDGPVCNTSRIVFVVRRPLTSALGVIEVLPNNLHNFLSQRAEVRHSWLAP